MWHQEHRHDRCASPNHAPIRYEALPRSSSYMDLGAHQHEDGAKTSSTSAGGPMPGRAIGYRVKKSRVMRWLVLHANGAKQQLALDKRQLIQHFHLDIPTRDMRLMDSTLVGAAHGGKEGHAHVHHQSVASSAGQLLVRDMALVVCMEHVRMIITADKVIVPLEDDRSDMSDRFSMQLEHVVQEWLSESMMRGGPGSVQGGGGGGGGGGSPVPGPHPLYPSHPNTALATAAAAAAAPHPAPPAAPRAGLPPQPQSGGAARRGGAPLPPALVASQAQGLGTSGGADGAAGAAAGARGPGAGGWGWAGRAHAHGPEDRPPSPQDSALRDGGGHADGGAGCSSVGGDEPDAGLLLHGGGAGGDGTPTHGGPASQKGDVELPFELAILEAGLGEVCSFLAREADLLQAQATPALEDLIANSDKTNLERVRRVKTAHQRLMSRVLTVREALHRLMEDDTDMWRMCLTKHLTYKRLASLAAANATSLSGNERGSSPGMPQASPRATAMNAAAAAAAAGVDALDQLLPASASLRTPSLLAVKLRQIERAKHVVGAEARISSAAQDLTGAPSVDNLDEDDWHNLLDVENLLEAYFTQADSTHSALMGLGEYIDDTEDLVLINLDYSRNKLIRFEIILTTGTFALAFYSCVAGILGENLVLPDFITRDIGGFVFVNSVLIIACLAIYFTIYRTLKTRKLL